MYRPPAFVVLALLVALVPGWARALDFSHKDWQLACDNTRTCRAAGYQHDGDEQAVSVLLTRRAGPGQAVEGRVRLGDPESAQAKLPRAVALRIDGRTLGSVALDDEGVGRLAPEHVVAMVRALAGTGHVAFVAGGDQWLLSDDGAAAVLLKMDEAQGRVGTVGALLRKGPRDERDVPAAVAPPVLQVPSLPATRPGDAALFERMRPEMVAGGQCDELEAGRKTEVRVWRLDDSHVLVSARCWLAAYNDGSGFWMANDKPPYAPRQVTDSGSDYDGEGTISAFQKGRGIGDCVDTETWTWDGRSFVHASQASGGMCRMVAAGGAWDLPTLVTDVRRPARAAAKEEKRK